MERRLLRLIIVMTRAKRMGCMAMETDTRIGQHTVGARSAHRT